jgi:hypothetical protein
MAHRKRISTAFLLALVCSVLVIGTVFAGSGIQHPNFEIKLGLYSTGSGWGKTRVLSPGPAYRPQVNCELQNNAGATISTAASLCLLSQHYRSISYPPLDNTQPMGKRDCVYLFRHLTLVEY